MGNKRASSLAARGDLDVRDLGYRWGSLRPRWWTFCIFRWRRLRLRLRVT